MGIPPFASRLILCYCKKCMNKVYYFFSFFFGTSRGHLTKRGDYAHSPFRPPILLRYYQSHVFCMDTVIIIQYTRVI